MKSILKTLPLLAFSGIFLFTEVRGQSADSILLSHFRPVSIYKIPKTTVPRAAYPLTDFHSHDFAKTAADVDAWVKTMDETGIARTIVLTYTTGKEFDAAVEKYGRYPGRFILWCGFDYTGFDKPGWSDHAIAELERCYRKGAKGIGELGDKGQGEVYSKPTPGKGIHIDDPKLKSLLDKCGALHMPISIHVAEDQWMYENPDSTNDGLMNAGKWHVNMHIPGRLNHEELLAGLENAMRQHPQTIFIACHLANCCADLSRLGGMLDAHPNMYADIAARYAEIAPIPQFASAFIRHYQDRLLYGTDMGRDPSMYRTTFHILESADEHFYETDLFDYHWPLYGLNLPKDVLLKLYKTNGEKLIGK